MCAAVAARVERSTKFEAFDLRDMHAEKRLPFKREAIEKEIHVVDRDGQVYKGAQGIVKIAGQYRGFGFLEKIAAVPLVRCFLPMGYAFVAANRRFLFGAASRIFWLKVIVVLAFCLGIALSRRLWIGPRSYPLAPVFDFLPQAKHPVDYVLFAGLLALAAAMLVAPRPQQFIVTFLANVGIFCLLDQTRWQPWVFLYGFMLATMALFFLGQRGRGRARPRAQYRASDHCGYLPLLVDRLAHYRRRPGGRARASLAGDCRAIDPGRVRAWAADTALPEDFTDRRCHHACLHLGHVRAARAQLEQHHLAVDRGNGRARHSFVRQHITEAEIYTNDRGRNSLPESFRMYLVHTSEDTNVLNIQRWAIEDLNVTAYPEVRVYKRIAKDVCRHLRNPADLVMLVHEHRLFFSKPETGYRCQQL
jgi:predicted DCC family thiol-disulfide oxidoreductase YuxK